MTLRSVRLHDVPPTPWRNGGGDTRTLLTWPSADGWAVRISVAGIVRDGPFSAYPGVGRWFAVLEGAGVLLAFAGDRAQRCTPDTTPLAFDGGDAPGCRLIDGPTQDLNLMLRTGAGTGGLMHAMHPLAPCTFRAVYCADATALRRGDAAPDRLPAGTLAWSTEPDDTAVWRIDANVAASGSSAARCWWLTFEAASARSGTSSATSASPSTPVSSS